MVSAVAEDAFEKRASRAGRKRRNDVRNRTDLYSRLDEIEDDDTRLMVRHMLRG